MILLRYILIVFSVGFMLMGFVVHPQAPKSKAREITDNMITSIVKIKTLKYNLKISERMEGKMLNTESVVKLQRSPRKIYLYLKGPEVLWIEGQNNGNALVNPGAFPYFNLNLDPYGSLMRNDQHHTLHEMGFSYIGEILEHLMAKTGDDFDKYVAYKGEEKWNNRDCYKITLRSPDFSFVNYTVKKGETLITIARKLKVSEYMILENNTELDDYNDVKEGDVIKVPTYYAQTTILQIDKTHMLPISIKIYDHKGLYESYEYFNLQLNPNINDEEFTKEYKDYDF